MTVDSHPSTIWQRRPHLTVATLASAWMKGVLERRSSRMWTSPVQKLNNEASNLYQRIQLRPNLHRLNPNDFGTIADFNGANRKPQEKTLVIGCADHGLAHDQFSFACPSDIVILQGMAASVATSSTPGEDSTRASIHFAMHIQYVSDIILCTHLNCRIIEHWMKASTTKPTTELCMAFNASSRLIVDELYRYTSQRERMTLMICEHTLFQLENLSSDPLVASKLRSRQLRLHGWVVDDATAQVLAYNPNRNEFQTLKRQGDSDGDTRTSKKRSSW